MEPSASAEERFRFLKVFVHICFFVFKGFQGFYVFSTNIVWGFLPVFHNSSYVSKGFLVFSNRVFSRVFLKLFKVFSIVSKIFLGF